MATPQYLLDALGELVAARPGYLEAERYYEGDVDEVFSSRRLRQLFADTEFARRFRFNFARTPVDALLERTQVQAITGSEPSAVNQLNLAWEDNQLGLEVKDTHRLAFEYGDSYIIGWPDEELPGGVELYSHSPLDVRVFYDPTRPRNKTHAIHTWTEYARDPGGNLVHTLRVNLYYPDIIEQWVSRQALGTSPDDFGDLVPFEDPDPDGVSTGAPVIENPFGVVPVFHFRTQYPYGRPEHYDAYGPQDAITKLMVTMMVSVDYSGYPQRFVTTDAALDTGFPTDAFGGGGGGGGDFPSSTDDTTGLSVDSSLEAGPGSTWLLSGANVKVGQFATTETLNFLNAIHSVIKQMAAVTDIPAHFYERSGQMPSGESLRQANRPLDAKVEDRQARFAVTWREVFDFCLAVVGMKPSDATVAWLPPSPSSDKENWETAVLQQQVGVPTDEVLLERGYMSEQVAEWVAPVPVEGVSA